MTITISWLKLKYMEQHREEDINLFSTHFISGPMMMACLAIFEPKISNKLINKTYLSTSATVVTVVTVVTEVTVETVVTVVTLVAVVTVVTVVTVLTKQDGSDKKILVTFFE